MDLTTLLAAARMFSTFSILNIIMHVTGAAPSDNIRRMLSGYSIELRPGDSEAQAVARERLRPGTEVFLAWIPGADPADLVKAATQLRRAGMFPVPHIAARHLESSAQLEQLAARLAEDAGVDRILLIAGDRAQPAGPYDSSLAVMRTQAFQKMGITRMAIAGFPEGNPNIPDSTLEEALWSRVNFAGHTGFELSIVTQFCFRAEPIVRWLERIRAQGIGNPVRVGLAGPASLATLLRYAVRCGIGNSLDVLREHPSFAKLLIEKGPEPIIREVVAQTGEGTNGNSQLGVAGLHFFVFGGFRKTVDWIKAQRPD